MSYKLSALVEYRAPSSAVINKNISCLSLFVLHVYTFVDDAINVVFIALGQRIENWLMLTILLNVK
jgi:hypothetical protein